MHLHLDIHVVHACFTGTALSFWRAWLIVVLGREVRRCAVKRCPYLVVHSVVIEDVRCEGYFIKQDNAGHVQEMPTGSILIVDYFIDDHVSSC